MVSNTLIESGANRFLLLTNILSTVRIDKLQVPEIIANDCLDAVLDCDYSGAAVDVTVLWLYNGTRVYEWKQGTEPKVSGVLDGRLDLTYRVKSADDRVEKRALRIIELTPELSGDYTCIVRSGGQEARGTKSMTVFSRERDFDLMFYTLNAPDVIHVKCIAKGLCPQPDLFIEYNKIPITRQQQRIWREGLYFDAECVAILPRSEMRAGAELGCRLQLPQVGYTAITKKYFNFGGGASKAGVKGFRSFSIIAAIILSIESWF